MCVNSILAIFRSTFSRHIHLAERRLWWAMRHVSLTRSRLRFR